jgi:hypothetical protein
MPQFLFVCDLEQNPGWEKNEGESEIAKYTAAENPPAGRVGY